MADPNTEDHADEMERDLHQLEDHITDAEKKLEARKGDADITGDVAGDWEGEQDRGGGDDPQGAAADERQGAPGGSQDGPGAEDAGAADAGGDDDGDEDDLIEEEAASPT